MQRVIVGKPKAARQKHPFSRSQTINAGLGSITEYEPVDHELLLDGRNGTAHASIVWRQEADERHQQQTRIELAASEALREGVAVAVESKLANRRVHVVANLSPTFQRCMQFETLSITHRAIQSNPCHDLGQGKMATTASHFPNSIVRLLPDSFHMVDQRPLLRPGRLDGSKSIPSCLVDGVHEFAVYVELELSGSGVANAHRCGTLVAGYPRDLPFGELPFTGQAI